VKRPLGDRVPAGLDRSGGAIERQRVAVGIRETFAFPVERVGEQRETVSRETVVEALAKRRQRLQLHLGIAGPGEHATGIAKADVLAVVDGVADVIADEAQHRAQLLQVLSRLVHRRVQVALGPFAQLLQGVVGAAPADPPDPVGRALLAVQPVGAVLDRLRAAVFAALERGLGGGNRCTGAGDEAGGELGVSVAGCAGERPFRPLREASILQRCHQHSPSSGRPRVTIFSFA
jgi:hypothetical protein